MARILGERVGRKGLVLLGAVAILGGALGARGAHAAGLTGLSPTGGPSTLAPNSGGDPTPGTGSGTGSATGRGSATRPSPSPTATKLGPLLSKSPYAPYAFQIYPGAPAAGVQSAMAGFGYSIRTLGSQIELTLTVRQSSQAPIRHTYPSSYHVYFIEASMGDDSGVSEFNFGDDGLVVTNAQGRIVG